MPTSTYPIVPCPAPRQSRRDAWNPSDRVMRYRAFRDECALRRVSVPAAGAAITFVLPMPASWSGKKKAAMLGQPHTQKPDLDNLLKALIDAVYRDQCDGVVHHYRDLRKVWGEVGAIVVETLD